MPCRPALQKRRAKIQVREPPPEIPNDVSDQEIREELGAVSHEDFHRRLDAMTDEQVSEFIKRLLERRKKRAEVLRNYVAQEARYA